MSIPVELSALATEIAKRDAGYLITTSEDSRPHTTNHRLAVTGGTDPVITCPSGRTASRNVADRPLVSLLWPPTEPGGYSLIVDGTATVVDGVAQITPTSAVLHRPAPDGGNDCKTPQSTS